MEFPVQLVEYATGRQVPVDGDLPEGPVLVHVPEPDLEDLTEVLDEIIAEQADFDRAAARRDRRRLARQFIYVAWVAAAALGMILINWIL